MTPDIPYKKTRVGSGNGQNQIIGRLLIGVPVQNTKLHQTVEEFHNEICENTKYIELPVKQNAYNFNVGNLFSYLTGNETEEQIKEILRKEKLGIGLIDKNKILSKKHLKIGVAPLAIGGGQFYLEDVGSTNNTFITGNIYEEQNGMPFQVADYELPKNKRFYLSAGDIFKGGEQSLAKVNLGKTNFNLEFRVKYPHKLE